MSMSNQFTVKGVLVEDPNFVVSQSGSSYAKITLAVESTVWNRQTKQEEPTSVDMGFYISGKMAEILKHTVKGGTLFIEGNFRPRVFKDKVFVDNNVIRLDVIHSGRKPAQQQAPVQQQAPQQTQQQRPNSGSFVPPSVHPRNELSAVESPVNYKNAVNSDGSVAGVDDDIPF